MALTVFRMIRGDRRNERVLLQARHAMARHGIPAADVDLIPAIDVGVRASTALQSD